MAFFDCKVHKQKRHVKDGLFRMVTMSLQSLFDLADQQSQRIKVSEVALKAAEEGVASAKTALLPSVEFNVHGSGKSGDLRWWCYPLGHRDG